VPAFGSGDDPKVPGSSPTSGPLLSREPFLPLSAFTPACAICSCSSMLLFHSVCMAELSPSIAQEGANQKKGETRLGNPRREACCFNAPADW